MRPTVRLLHTSDLHLHWLQREHGLRSIDALRRAAATSDAHAMLVAGDVFDTAHQSSEFGTSIAEAFADFEQPVVLIPGNHDIRYSPDEHDVLAHVGAMLPWPHRLISNVDGECLELLDGALHVWGRGMSEHTPANDPLAGLQASEREHAWSVVIAHGELTNNESSRSSPIVLERHASALDRIDYVALGHHDESSVVRFGSTLVCYSGSASPLLGSMEYALVELSHLKGASVAIRHLSME